MSIQHPINWIGLVLFCVLVWLTAMALYQAWVNLVHQKLSRFSLDALLAYFSQRVRTKNNIRGFPKNKTDIMVLGILALLAGLKGIQEIIRLVDRYKP